MRPRTAVAAVIIFVGLVSAAVFGLSALIQPAEASIMEHPMNSGVNEAPAQLESNHHTPAATYIGGESFAAVPINSYFIAFPL